MMMERWPECLDDISFTAALEEGRRIIALIEDFPVFALLEAVKDRPVTREQDHLINQLWSICCEVE